MDPRHMLKKNRALPILWGLLLPVLLSSFSCILHRGDAPPAEKATVEARERVWPCPPAPARIRYLHSISFPNDLRSSHTLWNRMLALLAGKNTVRMIRPYGLDIDTEGNMLITDPGAHRVYLYGTSDGSCLIFPKTGKKRVLITPMDAAFDGGGEILVSDSAAGAVYRFDRKGHLKETIGTFKRPTGLDVNHESKRLYVVDTLAHRIRVYGLNGKHLFDFGKRGSAHGAFNYPTHIALDSAGRVYVTDAMNFRIQAFTPDGKFLYAIGNNGDGPGALSKPKGVGLDSDGNLYVADAIFNNVQILNRKGEPLLYFGKYGTKPGEFSMPADLVIDSKDRIYVADSYNRRIQVFQYIKASGRRVLP
ncbi:MAG: 6-bladed beta-propeller [Deltaproteobacteria bacterium]|nr:6-bladed beta-propeller [Deltaproteobacteria bacterium]